MRIACLSIALAFTSCGGEPDPLTPAPAPSEVQATSSETAEVEEPPNPSTVEPPVHSGPAPTLSLVATPGPSHVPFSVANHGAAAVSLRGHVAVEVEHGGTFVAAESATALSLRYDCAHEAADCVTLAPGAELIPPEWLGTWGDMQCVCTRCGPVEPGSYRLVVTTCDGAHRVESNVFTLAGGSPTP